MRRSPVLIMAQITFKEALRRKVLVGALLFVILFLAVFGAGLFFTYQDMKLSGSPQSIMVRNQALNFLTLSGYYAVNLLYAVITVLASVNTISGEVSTGTIQALASKPVRRWEILLGKWLGLSTMLLLFLALLGGGITVISSEITGYRAPNVVRGLALIWLNGIILLNVTLLGGTIFSTLATGVFALAGFGIAFIGGWVEQIGSFTNSTAAVKVGIITSLLMPTEAIWKRAAYDMRSLVVDIVGFSPFTSATSVPSTLMIVYAGIYALVALAITIYRFQRLDL